MLTKIEPAWRHACATFSQISPAAMLLGATINVLDAVSLGLLLFPSRNDSTAFQHLQTQAVSIFIMSTIACQVVLVLGGSRLPVLGSMLADVLPFLRGGAISIQQKLGPDHPGVVPTVLVAYSLASMLLGIVFILLGLLRFGKLVHYFPHTVLTGAIGAIGISLCLLGFEVTLPISSGPLRLRTAASTLLNPTHLPLLASSVAPALVLSLSMRTRFIVERTKGLTKGPYFIPLYCLVIVVFFWAAVGLSGNGNSKALENLRAQGWLFPTALSQLTVGKLPWNYWTLFNFAEVQWAAIPAASENIALLITFGALGLPIFVPVTALALDTPSYCMDHEFLGHGISNILAGAIGTAPNSLVYSSSRFFALAGGGRLEAGCVTLLTAGFLFGSPALLPYVPTILAATLVLFFGIELLVDALWDSSKYYLKSEWITVVATSIMCSVLGFALGIGVGFSMVVILQFWQSLMDSLPRVVQPCTLLEATSSQHHFDMASIATHTQDHPSWMTPEPNGTTNKAPTGQYKDPNIIKFPGRVTFAARSKLEKAIDKSNTLCSYIIIHFDKTLGVDTSVAQYLKRKVQRLRNQKVPKLVSLSGVSPSSQLDMDLLRCGLKCSWELESLAYKETSDEDPIKVLAHEKLEDALRFCRQESSNQYVHIQDQDILCLLRLLFDDSTIDDVLSRLPYSGQPISERFRAAGIRNRVIPAGEAVACGEYPPNPTFVVLKGRIIVRALHSYQKPPTQYKTPSQDTVRVIPEAVYQMLKNYWGRLISREVVPNSEQSDEVALLLPGNHFGLSMTNVPQCIYAETPSWILEASTAYPNQGIELIREMVDRLEGAY